MNRMNMMNILIVKLSAIGDVIHTLPALNAIRTRYPDAHITWVVEEAAANLVLGHRALDRVLVSGRKRWIRELGTSSRRRALGEMLDFVRKLRDTRYDMVLDFQALLKSAMLVALARGERKIGFDRGMQHMEHSYLLLNERIAPVDMEIHALTRNMKMVQALGINSTEIVYDLPVTPGDRETACRLISPGGTEPQGPIVAINPVAKWDTKLWSNEKIAILSDRLTERYQARVVFTGAPEDRDTVEQIRSMQHHDSENLAGCTSLMTLSAVYEKADVVVSTDTGPMHLAAAVGSPVVALFGPTAPWRTGPFGQSHHIIRTGIGCSPCFKRTCESVECMKGITVDEVENAILRVDAFREKAGINPCAPENTGPSTR